MNQSCYCSGGIFDFKNWSELIIGVSWPLLVAIIVFYFRNEIKILITRVKSFRGLDFNGASETKISETQPNENILETPITDRMEKKILYTLWKHQKELFHAEMNVRRFTFNISKDNPEASVFAYTVKNLMNNGILTIDSEGQKYYLTNYGIKYCEKHESELGTDFYTFSKN